MADHSLATVPSAQQALLSLLNPGADRSPPVGVTSPWEVFAGATPGQHNMMTWAGANGLSTPRRSVSRRRDGYGCRGPSTSSRSERIIISMPTSKESGGALRFGCGGRSRLRSV